MAHLTPTFDNVLPLEAVKVVYQGVTNWSSADKRELAQGLACLICYSTNFVPSSAAIPFTASAEAPATAAECCTKLETLLQPLVVAQDAAAVAEAEIPWGTILLLALKLLQEFLKGN